MDPIRLNSARRGLSRRRFLAMLLASAAALAARPARLRADDAASVIVIGAGMAGLAAATTLKAAGLDVVVLEAKNRIGGRLYTDYSLGAPFEVGAGWIHGPGGNPISELADQAGVTKVVTEDDSLQVFLRDGTRASDDALARLDHDFARLLDRVDALMDEQDDMPLRDAVRAIDAGLLDDPLIAWALTAFTEFSTGGPIETLSADQFDEDDVFDGADVIVAEGYDKILPQLANGLDIRFGMAVHKVAYDPEGGVTVTTGKGEFEADYVICTVPLGALKAGRIVFEPPLPSGHRRSIDRIPMGNVTKAALKFEKAFWPTDVQYFGYASETKGMWPYFVNYRTFTDHNILVPLSFGAYAATAEAKSDAENVADIMTILRTMFGADVPDPSAAMITRWSQDPHTLGAYSYTGTGITPRDFDGLTAPVADVLFFAGEHVTFEYHGTVHGAYLTGVAAAEAVLEEEA